MDPNVIRNNQDRLTKSIPVVTRYLDKFHSINTRWAGAITAGMIDVELAFNAQHSGDALDKALVGKLQDFSESFHPSNTRPRNCWTT